MRVLGTEILVGGTPPCAVCGGRLRGAVFKLPDGRVWCVSHASAPRCTACAIPLGKSHSAVLLCDACGERAVLRGRDVVPVKEKLKRHMGRHGIVVATPTRIQLVDSSAAMSGDPHVLGMTNWTRRARSGVTGPITIQVLRGLPLPQFRHVMGHEFAHAAMAGRSGMVSLGPRLVEGFAESLALVHLRKVEDPGLDRIEASMLRNPDPVYGGGLRLVLPAVDRYGLPQVLEALRLNRPRDVGLPRQ